jgi:hypothetical protein
MAWRVVLALPAARLVRAALQALPEERGRALPLALAAPLAQAPLAQAPLA